MGIAILLALVSASGTLPPCEPQTKVLEFMSTNHFNVLAAGKGTDGKKYTIFYHDKKSGGISKAIVLVQKGDQYCPVLGLKDVFSDFDLTDN